MIETCLFDMGNVVVFFSHRVMCEQMGALCGREWQDVWKVLFDAGLEYEFERGEITEREFHSRFESAVDRRLDFEALHRAASDIFALNPPMPGILDGLKSRGLRLVLLSNTSVSHFAWIRERYDVLQRFDDFVLSCEVGAIKPDRAMYAAALRKIACEPGRCFYTDDVADNVEAARPFGLQAEQFLDVPTLQRQLAERGVTVE